jgi:hypothetical protein
MERKRAASPTRIAAQPALKSIERSGDDTNGPLSKVCHLPKKQVSAILRSRKGHPIFDIWQRRGGRRSDKDGATRSKRASNVEAHSNHHHQSVVRLSASDSCVSRDTVRCNTCLEAGKYCSCMHPEVAIQEYLFSIELPYNAHEVYMTAVENYRSPWLGPRRSRYCARNLIKDEALAECKEAFRLNQVGKLIVVLYGNEDTLVWNTLNDMFRISQDPKVSSYMCSLCLIFDTHRSTPRREMPINISFAYGV